MACIVVQAAFTAMLLCGFVNSYTISDAAGHGRVFDGIGAISGGSVSTKNGDAVFGVQIFEMFESICVIFGILKHRVILNTSVECILSKICKISGSPSDKFNNLVFTGPTKRRPNTTAQSGDHDCTQSIVMRSCCTTTNNRPVCSHQDLLIITAHAPRYPMPWTSNIS